MNKLYIVLFFAFITKVLFSQNLTIDKNPFFKGDGYILGYIIFDSTLLDCDSINNTILDRNFGRVFIYGQSCFLDSLCNLFVHFTDFIYMRNSENILKEILKLQYYAFTKRLFDDNFYYPEINEIESISSGVACELGSNLLPKDSSVKPGIYFRIIKVKMEGWIMKFNNYRQLKNSYAHTSREDNAGRMILTSTCSKKFEPVFRIYKEPYEVIYPKKILYYSDWILAPDIADGIKQFYKHLYIGPRKKHISYPKAARYLKRLNRW